MPDAPRGTRLDDLAIDEVSGVDRPAHEADGWLVLKSRAAQLDVDPEDLAAILEGAIDIARAEGYELADGEESDAEEVVDETPAPPVETPSAPTPELATSEVLKNLDEDTRSIVLKYQADAVAAAEVAKAATAELQKARDSHADREAVLKAREDWAYIPGLDPLTFGPLIRKARDTDPVFADAVAGLLTAASSALAESSLFTAAGSPTASSGLSELDAAVLKAREAHPTYTKAQLIAEAVMADPDLYDSYRASLNGG